MPKDPRARILLIHLAAYVVVVAICAAVNLWLSPDNLWFVWVALGWGIGIAAHALGYWLRHTDRPERIFADRRARGFTVHLFAYVAVIVLLFIVNLTATPNRWWFVWVALGWGAGIALHAWLAFGRSHEASQDRQNSKRKAPANKTAQKKTAAKKTARPRKSTGR